MLWVHTHIDLKGEEKLRVVKGEDSRVAGACLKYITYSYENGLEFNI